MHQYQTTPGRVVAGDSCLVCRKQYPSTKSLQNHLRYSRRCCTAFALRHFDDEVHSTELLPKHQQCPWRRLHAEVPLRDPVECIDFEQEALMDSLCGCLEQFVPTDPGLPEGVELSQRLTEYLTCVLPMSKIRMCFDAWVNKSRPLSYVLECAVPHVDAWLHSFVPVQTQEIGGPDLQMKNNGKQSMCLRPHHSHGITCRPKCTFCTSSLEGGGIRIYRPLLSGLNFQTIMCYGC